MGYEVGESFKEEWNRLRGKLDSVSGDGVSNAGDSLTVTPMSNDDEDLYYPTILKIKIIANIANCVGRYTGNAYYGFTNNTPSTTLATTDLGKVATSTVEIWNLSEIPGSGHNTPLSQSEIVIGVLGGYNAVTFMPIYHVAGRTSLGYAKIITSWTAGDTISANPCTNFGTLTGAAAITLNIFTLPASAIYATWLTAGQVVPYLSSTDGSNYIIGVLPYPTIVSSTDQYKVLSVSAGGTSIVWDYVRAHS